MGYQVVSDGSPPAKKVSNATLGVVTIGDRERMKEKGLAAQEAMLLAKASGKSATAAAKAAGIPVASAHAARIMVASAVDNNGSRLLTAMQRQGIDFDKIASVMAGGLEATRMVCTGRDKYESAPDWAARHKFLNAALDIIPDARPQKQQETGEGMTFERCQVVINQVMTPEMKAALEARALEAVKGQGNEPVEAEFTEVGG